MQSRAAVKVAIEKVLDQLPECYSEDIFDQKVGVVYEHVYESYQGAGKSIYRMAG